MKNIQLVKAKGRTINILNWNNLFILYPLIKFVKLKKVVERRIETMPFVRIQANSGRTPEQKKELAETIIDSMDKLGFASRESVSVIFEDMLPEDFYQAKKENK